MGSYGKLAIFLYSDPLGDSRLAQRQIAVRGHYHLKLWLRAGRFEACKRQVGFEWTVFRREAQVLHSALNLCCQPRKAGRGGQAGPEYARPFGSGEKAEALDANGKCLKPSQSAQAVFHLCLLLVRDVAQEFERQVNSRGAGPTGIGARRTNARLLAGEGLANVWGKLDCNECSQAVTRAGERRSPRSIF